MSIYWPPSWISKDTLISMYAFTSYLHVWNGHLVWLFKSFRSFCVSKWCRKSTFVTHSLKIPIFRRFFYIYIILNNRSSSWIPKGRRPSIFGLCSVISPKIPILTSFLCVLLKQCLPSWIEERGKTSIFVFTIHFHPWDENFARYSMD